jgi:hypothetical protein
MVVPSHASVANYEYLSEWIGDDASMQDTGAVLWYVFGLHASPAWRSGRSCRQRGVVLAQARGLHQPEPCLDAAPTEKDEDGLM